MKKNTLFKIIGLIEIIGGIAASLGIIMFVYNILTINDYYQSIGFTFQLLTLLLGILSFFSGIFLYKGYYRGIIWSCIIQGFHVISIPLFGFNYNLNLYPRIDFMLNSAKIIEFNISIGGYYASTTSVLNVNIISLSFILILLYYLLINNQRLENIIIE